MLMYVSGIVAALLGVESVLPMMGSGLFFTSLGLFFLFSGGLAELVSRTSDADLSRIPLLTTVEVESIDQLICNEAEQVSH